MKFVDLDAQLRVIEPEVRAAIDRVLAHGQYIMGPEVFELEEQLAAFAGARHAVSCSSGTDALLMALMAYDVGPGDAVFTTPFSFFSTAETIALLRATPVFVDIDPDTFNIDPAALEQAIDKTKREGTLRPRGVIPVDLYGLPADYDAICPLAKNHGLFVLADAAQSFGARYGDRAAGGLGDVCATSFFPAKPLGAYGDAGAVLTDDDELAGKLRSIRVHGQGHDRYDNIRLGLTARLDTLQAAVLLCKLKVFPAELEARNRIAAAYTRRLGDAVKTPFVPAGSSSAWAQYSIVSEQRERIRTTLHDAGIPTAVYYPIPLHLQTAFAYLGHRPGDFSVSEATGEHVVSLPIYPYLPDPQIESISEQVVRAVSSG